MQFNSFQFAIFFPLVAILHFVIPAKFQRLLLLIASIIFYISFIPKYILVLGVLILVDYVAGLLISSAKGIKRPVYLIASIFASLSILGLFKYFNFFALNIENVARFMHWNYSANLISIILPLGLSFHTFQSIAYIIDVYKKRQKAEKNLITYSLFVMFFPQLVAGPIERPQHLLPQLKKKHQFNYQKATEGLKLMTLGFFQKVVIADRLALFVNPIYNNPQGYGGYALIAATLFFAFQIYSDFAGYTNIARGAAKILGIDLVINFNKPYFATSVQDFWRRWHISLSSWFRDYLYIPIGGNRQNLVKTCTNILVVFAITGLWHGANWTFVIWGLIHGVLIALSQIFKKAGFKLTKPISIAVTFVFVCTSWIFFRAPNLKDATYIFSHLLNFKNREDLFLNHTINEFSLAVFLIFLVIAVDLKDNFWQVLTFKNTALQWAFYYIAIFLILLFGVFSQSKFIYFQF